MTGTVTGVNRHLKCAVIDHERYVWITEWFDADGDNCDPDDAVACVAGEDGVGWWSIDLDRFQQSELKLRRQRMAKTWWSQHIVEKLARVETERDEARLASLAHLGQAADAYEAQKQAEAERDALKEVINQMRALTEEETQ